MKRLKTHEISTLRHVHHHRRVCLGDITSEADAFLAETMAYLAKKKFLLVESTDDGPAYMCGPAALVIVERYDD